MGNKNEILMVEHYIKLFIRKRWLVIVPFCLCMAVGIAYSVAAKKIYEAKTLILVEPQSVPGDFVKPIVSSNINSRIATISQQIMSRSNLERIIREFNLYSGLKYKDLYMEDKLKSLQEKISVDVTRTYVGSDAFSISFKDSQPERSMEVANALAKYFIEANLQIREEQAAGTSSFLEAELDTMRSKLEFLDAELRDFRKKYMGELPEQLETNLRILDNLQTQQQNREERLRNQATRLMILQNEIKQLEREELIASNLSENRKTGSATALTPIQTLYNELADLMATYTEQHPDVVRLKKKIRELENNEVKGKITGDENSIEQYSADKSIKPTVLASKALVEKNQEKIAVYAEIKNLEAEIYKTNGEIREYQRRIEVTPKREEELHSLKRDYENIQNTYKSLLNRKLEADIAVNLEKKKKGEQFRILDYAKLPEKPVSPKLLQIFILSMALGFGIGGGLISIIDFLDTNVYRVQDMDDLGIPVLATIPVIYGSRQKVINRIKNAWTIISLLVAFILTTGFAFLAFKGVDPTLNLVRKYISI